MCQRLPGRHLKLCHLQLNRFFMRDFIREEWFLTVFQNFLLSVTELMLMLAKYFFLFLRKRFTQ